MGFYSHVIFPRLCDWVLRDPRVAQRRQELLAHARGRILEIGIGTGLNLQHYPDHVRRITAIDPNAGMRRLARRRMERSGMVVDMNLGCAESLPFGDAAFDGVVSTFTLCSVDDVEAALDEIYRVLRPGGHFLFLEHGLSPDQAVQRWQRRLNWLQARLGDGCRLDRNFRVLLAKQPFVSVQATESYLERGPKTHGYLYQGVAMKPASLAAAPCGQFLDPIRGQNL